MPDSPPPCMDSVEVLRSLGQGGYASVFLCRRKDSDARFAVKRIHRDKLATAQQQERLEAEKQVLLRAQAGPFLCRGVDAWESERDASLLLEYIDGRPLYQCIWGYRDTGKLPEHVARFFAAQIVLAVQELHALGYVHRDLKSGNILVDRSGKAVVIDFGLAKRLAIGEAGSSPKRARSLCGTPYILAPEVFQQRDYGYTVDWWGLGVVMYEMVCGWPPWEYKCPPGSSQEEYYTQIATASIGCLHEDGHEGASECAHACCLFIRDPEARLGADGAAQVMAHPWFDGFDWEALFQVSTHPERLTSPYDFDADFNAARGHSCGLSAVPLTDALSSAESIDPEDNAKYFADF